MLRGKVQGFVLYAYVDETGDVGLANKPGSSPIFGMAAVIVSDSEAPALRAALLRLRADYGVPEGVVMSAKKHLKTHDRRVHAAKVLAQVPGIRVIYVYCEKAAIPAGGFTEDRNRFYDHMAAEMYRAILESATSFEYSAGGLMTVFSHVKGHDHLATKRFIFDTVDVHGDDFSFKIDELTWVDPSQHIETQGADLFASFLRAAIWPDQFGNTEARYIDLISHLLVEVAVAQHFHSIRPQAS